MTTSYTDDEILGAAYILGREWNRPLMTVDVTDPDQLTAGVARGLRSLVLRGLLDGSGSLAEPAGDLCAAVEAAPRLVGAWVDEFFIPLPGQDRFELLERVDGAWLAASVTMGGVHAFAGADLESALGFFADVAKLTSEGDDAPQFCVIGFDHDARPAAGLIAAPGRVVRLDLRASGDEPRTNELSVDEVVFDHEVEALLSIARA